MPQLIDQPAERTTAATDLVLALLALGGAVVILGQGGADTWKASLWAWAFGLLGLSALLGAIAHGFKMSRAVNRLLWHPLNLALVGVIALFGVGVVYDLAGAAAIRWALPALLAGGAIFFCITLVKPDKFLFFVIYEALVMVFALGAYGWLAWQGHLPGAGLMAAGVLVTMIAAGVQASPLSLTLIWVFDHNGLYHLVQIAGLLFLVAGLRLALVGPS